MFNNGELRVILIALREYVAANEEEDEFQDNLINKVESLLTD